MIPNLPDLHVISIKGKLILDKHYSELQKACETHSIEVLVNRFDSSGRTVVSTRQEHRPNCDVGSSLTTAISIPITERWTTFLDNIRSPSPLTLGIEIFKGWASALWVGMRTNSSFDLSSREALVDHMNHAFIRSFEFPRGFSRRGDIGGVWSACRPKQLFQFAFVPGENRHSRFFLA